MNEWISVKDRLPFSEYTAHGVLRVSIVSTFIVHISDPSDPNERSNVVFADYATPSKKLNGGWMYVATGTPHPYAAQITHWMEMPDAPREFQKED